MSKPQILSLMLFCLFGCSGGKDTPGPVIAAFDSSSAFLAAGDSVQLTATFSGTAVLSPGQIAMSSGTPVTVGPIHRNTLYTLTVNGEDGSVLSRDLVVAVKGAASSRISAGTFHTVALRQDGTVWAWGGNDRGELGVNNTNTMLQPVQVMGIGGVGHLSDAVALSANYYQTLALRSDGTVVGWGWNANGELGSGAKLEHYPAPVLSLMQEARAVAAGGHHSVALKKDGTVWTWGNNADGQLGYATMPTSEQLAPRQVPSLSGVVSIAAGYAHTLALKGDGSLWAFGQNVNGELGIGTTAGSTGPVRVRNSAGTGYIDNVVAMAAAASQNWTPSDPLSYCAHSLALTGAGDVYAWGSNAWGQLGLGDTADRHLPVIVPGLTGVSAVSAAYAHSMALKDGNVFMWGRNGLGSLGNGTSNDSHTPVQVVGVSSGALENVVGIAVGGDAGAYVGGTPYDRCHCAAITQDGLVYAWGCNVSGELGNGSTSHSANSRPIALPLNGF